MTCNFDPGAVTIFLNDGAGESYEERVLSPGGTTFHSVAVDLDGRDGPDLVVVRNDARDLAIYLNDGEGRLELDDRVPAGSTDPKAIRAAHLNGDSFPDVAVANDAAGTVTTFLGDGQGGVTLKGTYTSGVQPRELVPVDLDANAGVDLVVVGGRGSDYVSRFLGNDDGTFGSRLDFTTGPRPNSVDAGDFDLDGHADVAVANWSLDNPALATLSILWGDGAGSFPEKTDFVPSVGFLKITALRIGQLDPTVFVRGDADLDRSLNITDPIVVLNYLFGDGTVACLDAADADDTGSINITDPIGVLQYVFLDGPAPLPPFPNPGTDPTPDDLGCD